MPVSECRSRPPPRGERGQVRRVRPVRAETAVIVRPREVALDPVLDADTLQVGQAESTALGMLDALPREEVLSGVLRGKAAPLDATAALDPPCGPVLVIGAVAPLELEDAAEVRLPPPARPGQHRAPHAMTFAPRKARSSLSQRALDLIPRWSARFAAVPSRRTPGRAGTRHWLLGRRPCRRQHRRRGPGLARRTRARTRRGSAQRASQPRCAARAHPRVPVHR